MFNSPSSSWIGKVYEIQGTWYLEKSDKGVDFVLEDDFKTSPGPDLKVYLLPVPMSEVGDRDSADQIGVFLEELSSPVGAQCYTIPSDINIEDYKSIAIHCKRYSVVWGGVNLG